VVWRLARDTIIRRAWSRPVRKLSIGFANAGQLGNTMVTKKSAHSVQATLDRLETALKEAGISIAARIDHATAADSVGLSLRPTQVLIFGNPKLGTPLMQIDQRIGIDLPLKVLAWEDDRGLTWLAYNEPTDIAANHAAMGRAEITATMAAALDTLTDKAIAR